MHKKRGGPRKSASLFYRLLRMLKELEDSAIGLNNLLSSQDSSILHAQAVNNRSQTQSGHDLVAEVLGVTANLVVDIVQSRESALIAEQLDAVLAPVAAEHGAQSSLQQHAGEAVADQGDNIAVETLHVLSSPSVGQVISAEADAG